MKIELRKGKTAAYYASYITIGFATGIIGPSLLTLSENAGTDLSGISYLFPILSVGYMLGSFISGRLYDKIIGHRIMAISVVLLLCSVFFIPLSPFIAIILTLFFLVGLGSGGVDVGGNSMLMWTHKDKVGPFMVGLHFFYGLGAFIAPMIVGLSLSATNDVAWAFRVLAIICVPVLLLLFIIKSPKRPGEASEEATKGSSKIIVLLLSLFMFLHVGAELSFGSWIYSFALKTGVVGISGSAYMTSAYWGAVTAARLLSVVIALKISVKKIILVDLIGCIIAALVLIFFRHSAPAVWVGTIMFGVFIASLIPSTFTYAGELIDMSGKVTSWFVMGIGAGNLVFPWLIGQMFETVGAVSLPLTILTSIILAAVVIAMVHILTGKRRHFSSEPGMFPH